LTFWSFIVAIIVFGCVWFVLSGAFDSSSVLFGVSWAWSIVVVHGSGVLRDDYGYNNLYNGRWRAVLVSSESGVVCCQTGR
jgi:nucleoside recognition membrane protein YjiH